MTDAAVANGSTRNRADAETLTTWGYVPEPRRRLLSDAMTSGGLLAALEQVDAIDGVAVGRLVAGEPEAIAVHWRILGL